MTRSKVFLLAAGGSGASENIFGGVWIEASSEISSSIHVNDSMMVPGRYLHENMALQEGKCLPEQDLAMAMRPQCIVAFAIMIQRLREGVDCIHYYVIELGEKDDWIKFVPVSAERLELDDHQPWPDVIQTTPLPIKDCLSGHQKNLIVVASHADNHCDRTSFQEPAPSPALA